MKTSKFVGLASALTMLASLAAMPASAAHINAYSVSYETLTEAITTDNGTTIPAGTIAVTMSVSGNRGFEANTFTLDIDEGYTFLTDSDDCPVIQKATNFEDALLGAAINENRVCITAAMSSLYCSDGELFTIYAENTNNSSENFVDIVDTLPATILESASAGLGGNETNHYEFEDEDGNTHLAYRRGDANDDNVVNSMDAALILSVLSHVEEGELQVSAISSNFNTYFPDIIAAGQPDANKTGWINNNDATIILNFAATVGAGGTYTGAGHNYINKVVSIN